MKARRRRQSQEHLSAGAQGGFTLLELLVVIAMLGVVSGVAVFSMGTITDQAEKTACAADEQTLVTALEAYAIATGSYGDEDALVAAGYLDSISSSHDVELAAGGYSIIATGDCMADGTEEIAEGAEAPDGAGEPTAGDGPGARSPVAVTTTAPAPTTTTTTAAPTATRSISSISSVRAVNVSTNNWRATATVQVTDELGEAVSGAGVTLDVQRQGRTGSWSDMAGVSGTTNGAGSVVVSSTEVAKYPVPKIRFRVSSVSAPGLAWQQNDDWSEVAKP
ncbi:MAG: competence type IV pilus major pilin ComGC [Microthrixaceae bacterium]